MGTGDEPELISAAGRNKALFAEEWTRRPEFINQSPPTLSNSEYVDKVLQISGYQPGQSQRVAMIENLEQGKLTRASILLNLSENLSAQRQIEEAFVTFCYFVYLKRDPVPEGYKYWLQALRTQSAGKAALIPGFLNSGEYRARFGQP